MPEELDALNEARGAEDAFKNASKEAGEGRNAELRESLSLMKKLNDALAQSLSLERDQNATLDQRIKNQNLVSKLSSDVQREAYMFSGKNDELSKDQTLNLESQLSSARKIVGVSQGDIASKVKAIGIDKEATAKKLASSKMLSDLTGGLAPKALNFMKALRANPIILLISLVVGLVKMLLSVNQEITEIGRGLGVSADNARDVRANFAAIQGASSNILNTTEEINKAQSTLNAALGTSATMISGKILDGMATLQNRMGLSAEAAVSFAQSAMLSGQSVDQLKLAAIGSAAAVERERGTRLDIRGILKETGTITGQIRAQLGGSVEAISSAVAKAKSLGMELKGVAAAGKQLLDFEQSISAELEAELLTGKQLNLEKARLAALTGDYSTLTEEINANVGDFYEFSKLNVIQQEKLAQAVGMEANQLADILVKKENIADLAQRARIEGDKELAANLEQLSTQEKFNAAIEKLKVVVVNLVAKLESSPIISGLFSLSGAGFEQGGIAAGRIGAGKEADIEGAIERGMSKARINVSTRYDSFGANNKVGSVYTGKVTNASSYV